MKYIILTILFFIIFTIVSYSQTVRNVQCCITYKVLSTGTSSDVEFKCLLPNDIENIQKIKQIHFSVEPDTVFIEDNHRYANFKLGKINKDTEFTIITNVEIYKNDFKRARTVNRQDDDLERYLINERYIEKDNPEIQKKALELKSKNDEIKTIKNIYTFVNKHITYKYFPETKGAEASFESKEGVCGEFSDLFVALCRANDIPARVICGYVVTQRTITSLHAWAEVYTQQYGWVRIDPTGRPFSDLENEYIQYSNIRNNPILGSYSVYRYRYIGDPVYIIQKIEFKYK